MRPRLTLTLALAACALALPASAQESHAYFTARLVQPQVPPQLSTEDRAYYTAVFAAIDAERWNEVETLLEQRDEGLLHPVARAEFYLAANSPRVELPAIEAWLATGSELPQAAQLARLAVRRGAAAEPYVPQPQPTYQQPGFSRRTRPATVNDGTMPASTRSAILNRITEDDPEGAHALLLEAEPAMSAEARAEWRQRVAWSYFIENRDPEALALAQTVADGAGAWVAEGEWVAGLSAWRLGNCGLASDAFERAGIQAQSPDLRAAAFYWAARAGLRCRQPEFANRMFGEAAADDRTLYGMLAAEQLGQAMPARMENADVSEADWQLVGGQIGVRSAVALAEIGRDGLASQILSHQARIADPSYFAVYSRLARALGFPQTQLNMAFNAPAGGQADDSAFFPAPLWAPADGWRVDPALAFAHTLQESNFQSRAVSPADARGLMQITPITVRQHAPCIGRAASEIDVFDPPTNLSLGQCNLLMLRDDPATGGRLPQIMAAYNAGMTPIRRWETEINHGDDPLLYMEAIPYWETRSYVAIVMRNYWMYERQARAQSPSRRALAQNVWPLFPAYQPQTDGRVYFSVGDE